MWCAILRMRARMMTTTTTTTATTIPTIPTTITAITATTSVIITTTITLKINDETLLQQTQKEKGNPPYQNQNPPQKDHKKTRPPKKLPHLERAHTPHTTHTPHTPHTPVVTQTLVSRQRLEI